MAGNNSCGGRSLRYGTMRDNTRVDAMRRWPTARLLHFGEVRARSCAAERERQRACAVSRHARSRRARGRRDRGEIPEGAAPRRRLQSRCAGAAQRAQQPGASAGRLRRHAGLHHAGRAEAVAGHPQQGARRLPFRQFLRGDGRRPASGQAAPDRGRTGRPHHAGAGPRDRDVPADHRDRRPRRSRRGADRRIRRGRPGRKYPSPEAARRADGRSRLRLGQAAAQMGRRGRDHRSPRCRPASPSSAPPASTS